MSTNVVLSCILIHHHYTRIHCLANRTRMRHHVGRVRAAVHRPKSRSCKICSRVKIYRSSTPSSSSDANSFLTSVFYCKRSSSGGLRTPTTSVATPVKIPLWCQVESHLGLRSQMRRCPRERHARSRMWLLPHTGLHQFKRHCRSCRSRSRMRLLVRMRSSVLYVFDFFFVKVRQEVKNRSQSPELRRAQQAHLLRKQAQRNGSPAPLRVWEDTHRPLHVPPATRAKTLRPPAQLCMTGESPTGSARLVRPVCA